MSYFRTAGLRGALLLALALLALAACGEDIAVNSSTSTPTSTPVLVPKYVYTANNGSNDISAYSIDAGTGELTGVTGAPFASGNTAPRALTVGPGSKYLYVTHGTSANNISVFAIDQATGALSHVMGSPFSSAPASNLFGVAAHPSGNLIYVTHSTAATVSGYLVDPTTGFLTSTGSPSATFSGPEAIVIDTTGSFLYTADRLSPTDISAFSIDTTTGILGGLTSQVSDAGPTAMVIDPTGAFIHITTGADNLTSHSIDPNTGVMAPFLPVTATGAVSTPKGVAMTPDGAYLYTANSGTNDISRFSVDAGGDLLGLTFTPAGLGAWAIAVAQNGEWAYVANRTENTVSEFSIDSVTGNLTSLGVAVPAGTQPQSIAVAAFLE